MYLYLSDILLCCRHSDMKICRKQLISKLLFCFLDRTCTLLHFPKFHIKLRLKVLQVKEKKQHISMYIYSWEIFVIAKWSVFCGLITEYTPKTQLKWRFTDCVVLIYCFVYSGQETFAYFCTRFSHLAASKSSTSKTMNIVLVC